MFYAKRYARTVLVSNSLQVVPRRRTRPHAGALEDELTQVMRLLSVTSSCLADRTEYVITRIQNNQQIFVPTYITMDQYTHKV